MLKERFFFFKEHINTWKMLVSRRNRTRVIFILVYLTVIIHRDIPITSGESERVCGSLSRCVVRRTQGCCVASAFRASGS